MLNYYYDEVKI